MKNQKIKKNKILGGGEPPSRRRGGAKEFIFEIFARPRVIHITILLASKVGCIMTLSYPHFNIKYGRIEADCFKKK